jgi:hypothetical protein
MGYLVGKLAVLRQILILPSSFSSIPHRVQEVEENYFKRRQCCLRRAELG